MALLIVTFALIVAGLAARGEAAGADARAYWAGVRIWLAGGDPYHPTGPFMPYVYAPWMLPLFAPWAAAALGRRLVRVAGRHDPPAALDDRLGLPPAAARDRRDGRRCWPSRSPRTSTPGTSTCSSP